MCTLTGIDVLTYMQKQQLKAARKVFHYVVKESKLTIRSNSSNSKYRALRHYYCVCVHKVQNLLRFKENLCSVS